MAFRALRRLVADIDEQHRESMRSIETDLAELHFGEHDAVRAASRRSFLQRAATGGAIAFGATLLPLEELTSAAFAETGGSGGAQTTSAAAGDAKVTGGDLTVVVFAQTVELAAAAAYDAAVSSGKLDDQAKSFATLFAGHHRDHANALAGLAGKEALNVPNPRILAEFGPQITGAANGTAQLKVLQSIEEGAVSTYLYALGEFVSYDAAGAASMVLPIEAQHSVALSFLIEPNLEAWAGKITTYVPNFETESNKLEPARYPAS